MLIHRRDILSITFSGAHLYTWVERDTLTVKLSVLRLPEDKTQYPQPGFKPGPLDPGWNALSNRKSTANKVC